MSDIDYSKQEESSTEKLIKLLIHQPHITQAEIANQMGYSKAWVRKVMRELQQNGSLRREGATKKGSWIVL